MVNLQELKTSLIPSLDRAMSGLVNEIVIEEESYLKGGSI